MFHQKAFLIARLTSYFPTNPNTKYQLGWSELSNSLTETNDWSGIGAKRSHQQRKHNKQQQQQQLGCVHCNRFRIGFRVSPRGTFWNFLLVSWSLRFCVEWFSRECSLNIIMSVWSVACQLVLSCYNSVFLQACYVWLKNFITCSSWHIFDIFLDYMWYINNILNIVWSLCDT